MYGCDHHICAKIKRVIMSRDVYPRKWGLGPKVSYFMKFIIKTFCKGIGKKAIDSSRKTWQIWKIAVFSCCTNAAGLGFVCGKKFQIIM